MSKSNKTKFARFYLSLAASLLGVLLMSFILTACHSSPIASAQDSQGNIIHLSDYHGKWIVLNYWASWCKPCMVEIPQLNEFYRAHKNTDAVVLGVNFDQVDNQQLQKLVQKFAISYPVLNSDPGPKLGIEHVQGLPSSYLINPEGKLVKTLMGEQTQKQLEFAMGLASGPTS